MFQRHARELGIVISEPLVDGIVFRQLGGERPGNPRGIENQGKGPGVLRAACADFREMHPNRAENWCCGGGGGLSAMDDIREFRMVVSGRKKLEQICDTGAECVAAACSNCKRQLTQLMEYHRMKTQVGGVHDMLSRAILINGKAAVRNDYT
jgi:hypothetical protein